MLALVESVPQWTLVELTGDLCRYSPQHRTFVDERNASTRNAGLDLDLEESRKHTPQYDQLSVAGPETVSTMD